jgi:hemolysin-activating ACP:hemolysin acyltransferase
MALWSRKSDDDKTADTKAEPAAPCKTNAAAGATSQTALAPNASVPPQISTGLRGNGAAMPAGVVRAPIGQALSGQQPCAVQAPRELSTAEVQKRVGASKQQLMAFGEIVSVLMRSPQFRTLPLGEVETLVVPAVVTGQFLVAEAQSKANGFVVPVATALWASVSEEVDRQLSQNLDQPFRLAANEWKSGEIAWLVALAGDARVINPMLKQLQDTTLQGRPLKMRAKGKDGKEIVGTFALAAGQPVPAAS